MSCHSGPSDRSLVLNSQNPSSDSSLSELVEALPRNNVVEMSTESVSKTGWRLATGRPPAITCGEALGLRAALLSSPSRSRGEYSHSSSSSSAVGCIRHSPMAVNEYVRNLRTLSGSPFLLVVAEGTWSYQRRTTPLLTPFQGQCSKKLRQ
jgi:hypothetical protein